jgi:rare lipoprotein A
LRRALAIALGLIALGGLVVSCSGHRRAQISGVGYQQKGLASWYGPGFHGKRTANGEVYDMNALTAAHRSLPFDVIVEVQNLDNGASVLVRINDRGPFVRGRIIDLSREGAKRLGMLGPGTARVKLRVVGGPRPIERTGSFWVQVGAFRDRSNAHALEGRLKREFPGIRVRRDGDLYRVGVGPFSRKSEADEAARKLERAGHQTVIMDGL